MILNSRMPRESQVNGCTWDRSVGIRYIRGSSVPRDPRNGNECRMQHSSVSGSRNGNTALIRHQSANHNSEQCQLRGITCRLCAEWYRPRFFFPAERQDYKRRSHSCVPGRSYCPARILSSTGTIYSCSVDKIIETPTRQGGELLHS